MIKLKQDMLDKIQASNLDLETKSILSTLVMDNYMLDEKIVRAYTQGSINGGDFQFYRVADKHSTVYYFKVASKNDYLYHLDQVTLKIINDGEKEKYYLNERLAELITETVFKASK